MYDKNYCVNEIENLEGEEFREVYASRGRYFISNLGRIISCTGMKACILKPTVTEKGYERIQLYIEGERYSKLVHTLVANE